MPPRKKAADKDQPNTEAEATSSAETETSASAAAKQSVIADFLVRVDDPEAFVDWLDQIDDFKAAIVVETEQVGEGIAHEIGSVETEEGVLIGLDPNKSNELVGNIRSFILDRLRNAQDKRSWDEQNESQQRQTIHDATEAARYLVRETIGLIGGRGHDIIKATVKGVKSDGDKIEAGLIVGVEDEHRHDLFDAAGHSVIVVVTDPEQYMGEGKPVPIKADQTDLLVDAVQTAWDGEGDPPADQPGNGETGELDLAGEEDEDVRPQFMKDNEASKNEEAE